VLQSHRISREQNINWGNFFMWQRTVYKKRAWTLLRETYWLSFGICIVAQLLIGAVSYVLAMPSSFFTSLITLASSGETENVFALLFSGAIMTSALFMSLATIAASIFLACPINVGQDKFFLEARKGNRTFDMLFSSFKSKRYLNIVKGMAWQILFTFLWTLLFYIPGIIKSYSYCMTQYILADNPEIGYRRALKLSMQMTRGYKWHIFVLQLSFIGWYLLGLLCCGIGIIFVHPYYNAALAEAYAFLRKNAMEKGYCTPAELNLASEDYFLDYPDAEKY
jgi:hypothetical protein